MNYNASLCKVDIVQENVGITIFQEALKEAIQRIIGNAVGQEHVGSIIEEIDKAADFLVGYNVRSKKVENMMDAGVVDSYKVIKSIIEDSVTLSNMIIMTEWNVVKRKEYTPLPLEEHHKYREQF